MTIEHDDPEPHDARPDAGTVVDASAMLALLFGEPGAEKVADAIADGAVISAVNLAEVMTCLRRRRVDPTILARVVAQVHVTSFTEEDAMKAAELAEHGERVGLSLADRAGIALALRLGAPAMTADTAWAQVSGVDLVVIAIRP